MHSRVHVNTTSNHNRITSTTATNIPMHFKHCATNLSVTSANLADLYCKVHN